MQSRVKGRLFGSSRAGDEDGRALTPVTDSAGGWAHKGGAAWPWPCPWSPAGEPGCGRDHSLQTWFSPCYSEPRLDELNLETNCQSFKGRKIYQVVGWGEGQAAPHREDAGAGFRGCKAFAEGGRARARLRAAWAAERDKGREERHEASSPRAVSRPRGAPGRQVRLWAEGPGARPRAGLKSAWARGRLARRDALCLQPPSPGSCSRFAPNCRPAPSSC